MGSSAGSLTQKAIRSSCGSRLLDSRAEHAVEWYGQGMRQTVAPLVVASLCFVAAALQRRGVRTILLDEAQHLLKLASGVKMIDQLDWLKSMTNTTGVLYIKYNLKARRRLVPLTSGSCDRIQ